MGRLIAVILFAVGLGILTLGIQQWHAESEVSAVVRSFLEATLRGDRDGALACFDPARAAAIYARPTNQEDRVWTPSPGFAYRVSRVDIAAETAVARVRIRQGEFVCEPIVELHPVDGIWRITRIHQFHFRQYGTPPEQQTSFESGDLLAAELQKAFHKPDDATTSSLAAAHSDNQQTR